MKKLIVLSIVAGIVLVLAPAAFAGHNPGWKHLAEVSCWPGGVLTGFDEHGRPLCDCLPPFVPVPDSVAPPNDYWSVTKASIDGGPNAAVVDPGGTFTVSVEYSHTVIPACPACIIQFQLGFSHLSPEDCIVSYGFAPMTGTGSTTFTAPMEPGIYYIDATRTLEYSCLDHWQWAQYHVAAVCVKGPAGGMDDVHGHKKRH